MWNIPDIADNYRDKEKGGGVMFNIKGRLAEVIGDALADKVESKELGRNLDAQLDAQIGAKSSEKIQRGVIRGMLTGIIDGLCEEDPIELATYYEAKATKIRAENVK